MTVSLGQDLQTIPIINMNGCKPIGQTNLIIKGVKKYDAHNQKGKVTHLLDSWLFVHEVPAEISLF